MTFHTVTAGAEAVLLVLAIGIFVVGMLLGVLLGLVAGVGFALRSKPTEEPEAEPKLPTPLANDAPGNDWRKDVL